MGGYGALRIGMQHPNVFGTLYVMIKLHKVLDNYGIKNSFEIYHGTHISHVAYRFQNHVIPFFSGNLCFKHCAHRYAK